ncbi:MAG: zinc ribbon domain-containing protein [Ktedonobacteraceae bacterium]
MAQNYVVPDIYSDMSNQSQGYFAFRFTCQICRWQIDSMPIRSTVSTATNVMDIGVGLLGGFWGRAAQAGEQIYGSKWHQEQAQALQKSWASVQHEFHLCPKCHYTVCMRCYNPKLNLCTNCAPDLKADGASFQHEMNVEAQRQQIQQSYQAPQFNVGAIPSAVTPDLVRPPQQPQIQPPVPPRANNPLAGTRFDTPGYPGEVMCPTCRHMGPPGKFCQDCGTKLPLPDLFCPTCAEKVEPGARFCQECGAKLQQAT